ncbi:hypothetical protein MMC31_007620 [Peltigera leucophlebia]|nr:hypothetical protein [Peltigera leucophlebia]
MHIKSITTILVTALATAVSASGKHAFTSQNFLSPIFWPGSARLEDFVPFYANTNDPGNGAVRLYEFYNTVTEEWLYTTSEAERASIPVQAPNSIAIDYKGWIESSSEFWTWPVMGDNKVALYRSYQGGENRYTTKGGDRIETWVYNGPVNGAVPIYSWVQN